VAFVEAGGITVHYDVSGPADAPVVVLANSLGTSVHMWDDQVGPLAASYRVLRYDMRGHGLTECSPPGDDATGRVEVLADDVAALLDALGIERVRFVGLSIGGMVGQRFAAAYPQRIEALALCATATRVGTAETWDARIAAVEQDGLAAIADSVMIRWFTETTRARRHDVIAGFTTMLTRTPVPGYVAGCRAVRDADLRADDARIRCRTLVVAGALDPGTTPAMRAEVRDAIGGAEFLVLDDASHMLCVEQPTALNRALLRFLEG
jgi:3-oxoadipate enol-lactonase